MADAVGLWVIVYFCVTSVNTKDTSRTNKLCAIMYTICAKEDSSLLRRRSQKVTRRLSIVTWSGSLPTSPYTMQLVVDGMRYKIL